MRNKGLCAAGVLLAALLPDAAHAQAALRGVYAGIIGTYVWPPEATIEDSRNPGGANGRLTYQHDFGYGFIVGYAFPIGIRVEAEGMMRQIDNDQLIGGGFGSRAAVANLNGDFTNYSGMVNVLYEPVRWWRITPYLGGGIGASKVTMNAEGIGVPDTSDVVFAYQVMGGVRMPVWQQLYFSVGYKYFAIDDPHLAGAKVSGFHTNNLEFTLTWQF